MKARLYYELHVTVTPSTEITFKEFSELAGETWRASVFDVDFVDEADGKWFLTARCDWKGQIAPKLRAIETLLARHGVQVTRMKAEETIFDTKYGDLL